MSEKFPIPDKDEARRLTAAEMALQLGGSTNPEMLVHNAKIIEAYLIGN